MWRIPQSRFFLLKITLTEPPGFLSSSGFFFSLFFALKEKNLSLSSSWRTIRPPSAPLRARGTARAEAGSPGRFFSRRRKRERRGRGEIARWCTAAGGRCEKGAESDTAGTQTSPNCRPSLRYRSSSTHGGGYGKAIPFINAGVRLKGKARRCLHKLDYRAWCLPSFSQFKLICANRGPGVSLGAGLVCRSG